MASYEVSPTDICLGIKFLYVIPVICRRLLSAIGTLLEVLRIPVMEEIVNSPRITLLSSINYGGTKPQKNRRNNSTFFENQAKLLEKMYLCSRKTGKMSNFRKEIAIEAILYIANRVERKDIHKICKILYYADQRHLSKYGRSITGDTYIAMAYGPVPSNVEDIFKAVRGDSFFSPYVDNIRKEEFDSSNSPSFRTIWLGITPIAIEPFP